jgi:hypothetical protein
VCNDRFGFYGRINRDGPGLEQRNQFSCSFKKSLRLYLTTTKAISRRLWITIQPAGQAAHVYENLFARHFAKYCDVTSGIWVIVVLPK